MRDLQRSVFVMDSDEACRERVEAAIAAEGHCVHVFGNSQTCWDNLRSGDTTCDLVITGLRLFPIEGLALIEKIRSTNPSVPVIVLSSSGSLETAFQAIKLGVSDFVEKSAVGERLVAAVQTALARPSAQHLPVRSILSATEYDVLLHILEGKSTKEISVIRSRSPRTIEDQRSAVMTKLGVDNLVDLVKRVAFVVMPTRDTWI